MPTPVKRDSYKADLMREMRAGGQTRATAAGRASSKRTSLAISSPPAPSVDSEAIKSAAERKLAQKRALETVNAARVRGLTDTTRSAREIKRASFDTAQPQARGAGQNRVWVDGFTRKDGTRVKGHWRVNSNPASMTDKERAEEWLSYGLLSPAPLILTGAAVVKGVHDAYKAVKGALDVATGRKSATYQLDEEGRLVSQIPTEIQAGGMAAAGLAMTGSVVGMRGGVKGAVGTGGGRIGHNGGPAMPASDLNELGLYSQALRAARALPQKKGTPEQMLAMLKRAGVKDDEIKWTGLEAMMRKSLAGRNAKPEVTKQQIIEYLEKHGVRLRQETYGGGVNIDELYIDLDENLHRRGNNWVASTLHHGDWVVRPLGGNRYAAQSNRNIQVEFEMSSTPTADRLANEIANAVDALPLSLDATTGSARYAHLSVNPGNPTYREQVYQWMHPEGAGAQNKLHGGHFDVPGATVHTRTLVEELADPPANTNLKPGDRVFHIDEIQSDAAQDARKLGIRPTGNELRKLQAELKDLLGRLRKSVEETTEIHNEAVQFVRENTGSGFMTSTEDVINSAVNEHARQRAREIAQRYNDAFTKHQELVERTHALQARVHGVESMPYIDSTNKWVDLALKTQLVRAARDPNVKGVSFISGEDVARRFSQVEGVESWAYNPRLRKLVRQVPGGHISSYIVDADKIVELVGSQRLAQQILAKRGAIVDVPILSQKGQGNVAFYDKIVPQRLKEIARKIDPQAKIGEGKLSVQSADQSPVKVLELTDKMREKIINDGLSLFVNRPGSGVPAMPLMTPREQREAEHRAALRESVRRRSRQRREFYRALARGDAT